MKEVNSSIGRTVRSLKLKEAKMKKDKQLESGVTTVVKTRDGRSNMLIKLIRLRLRDSMKNSASTSIDHSTWFLKCQ